MTASDPGASAGPSNLRLRIISAAVLIPLALGCGYLGGWVFLVICGAAAGGILWEWTRLVAGSAAVRPLLPGGAALVAAVALIGVNAPVAAVAAIGIGAVAAAFAVAVGTPRQPAPASSRALWAAAGVAYAGAALLGPALLRRDPQWGLAAVLFVAITVWLTDIFAYAVGRTLGGPLLWPRVSPNKTWAGAFGGLAGGVAGGTVVAYASGAGSLGAVGLVAVLLSVLTQAGDLFESAVKRRFGAKDASHLIPGHGGLMDRLDGFLVAALAALIVGLVRQGMDAPGRGLLLW